MNANQLNEPATNQKVTSPESTIASGEVVIGTLSAIGPQGQPLVVFTQSPSGQPVKAIATLALTQQHINRQVALLFNQGDFNQPIVMGLIHSPLEAMLESYDETQVEGERVELSGHLELKDVCIEGKTVTFEAEDEMVFKCGNSSITLTKDGKIMIRGKYLLSRSSGVNRIMGGSVQVN